MNFNLELYSSKNEENNKENISDNIVNIAFGGKYNLNIANRIKEECNKNDNDLIKEEEYEMLKQNCVFKVIILFKPFNEFFKSYYLLAPYISKNKKLKRKSIKNIAY